MKKLKIILQSNYFYYFLGIFIVLYVLLINIVLNNNVISSSNEYEGLITNVYVKDETVTLIIKGKEKVRGSLKKDNSDYYELLGKQVKIKGTIKEINNNTIPNIFNYKKYLKNNNIKNVYDIKELEIIKEKNILYKIKYSIIKRINSYDDKIIPYLNLFILGDKSLLDESNINIYETNGIYHLFAISGMHLSLIVLILSFFFKKFKYKQLLVGLFLLFFMFMTDFAASVERASIFYMLKELFKFKNLNIIKIKILFLTLFIIIIINPYMIYNIGLQYSFIITLGIMVNSKYISGKYYQKIFKISSIAIIFSLPITINLNYEINLLSIFLNIIYVPFISFIIFPLSLLCFLFKFLSPILNIMFSILELTNKFFLNYRFNLIIPKMPIILIIVYYLFLLKYSQTRKKLFLLSIIIIVCFNIILPKLDNSFRIYYLDVGQGDSNVIISPYQKNIIMIDTGGTINYQVSNNIIIFLKSLGITKIKTLILTHGDYDHMGEAINLVNNFKVEKVIFNCGPYNDLENELIKVLDKKNIKYYSCVKELNIDKNKLYFLQTKEYDNENDNSNVIYTEIDGYKFMFMGDASITTEKEILNKYNLSDIDVFKVGHHGSKTSSDKEFINEVNPKYSIISVGKNNRYGHPNKEVLNTLSNSKVYRTDLDGSIMFKIKNNKLKIETCSP